MMATIPAITDVNLRVSNVMAPMLIYSLFHSDKFRAGSQSEACRGEIVMSPWARACC